MNRGSLKSRDDRYCACTTRGRRHLSTPRHVGLHAALVRTFSFVQDHTQSVNEGPYRHAQGSHYTFLRRHMR